MTFLTVNEKYLNDLAERSQGDALNQDVLFKGDLVEITVMSGMHISSAVILGEGDLRSKNRSKIVNQTRRGLISGYVCGQTGDAHDTRNTKYFIYSVMLDEGYEVFVSPAEIKPLILAGPDMVSRRNELTRIVDEKLSGIGRKRFELILRRKVRGKTPVRPNDALDDAIVDAMEKMQSDDYDK